MQRRMQQRTHLKPAKACVSYPIYLIYTNMTIFSYIHPTQLDISDYFEKKNKIKSLTSKL